MKFGIHHPSWVDGPDPAEAFEAAKAQWAENHGFVWFSVQDHMIQTPLVGPPDEPLLEGWTVLAGLAAVTSRVRLATLVTAVGYRNPAPLAKIAASVDLISRGRLTLGIGAGFFEDEYKQYGWEFPPRPATRIRQMEEAIQLVLKLWTEPRTTFRGRHGLGPAGRSCRSGEPRKEPASGGQGLPGGGGGGPKVDGGRNAPVTL